MLYMSSTAHYKFIWQKKSKIVNRRAQSRRTRWSDADIFGSEIRSHSEYAVYEVNVALEIHLAENISKIAGRRAKIAEFGGPIRISSDPGIGSTLPALTLCKGMRRSFSVNFSSIHCVLVLCRLGKNEKKKKKKHTFI